MIPALRLRLSIASLPSRAGFEISERQRASKAILPSR
jgi:hypothetical protein